MSIINRTIKVIVSIGFIVVSAFGGTTAASESGVMEDYRAQCRQALEADAFSLGGGGIPPRLLAFIHAEVMADMVADPGELARLVDTALTPEAMMAAFVCMQEPELRHHWMSQLTDHELMTGIVQRLATPQTMLTWADSMSDPQTHATMMRLMNPVRYMQMMMSMMQFGTAAFGGFPVATHNLPPAVTKSPEPAASQQDSTSLEE